MPSPNSVSSQLKMRACADRFVSGRWRSAMRRHCFSARLLSTRSVADDGFALMLRGIDEARMRGHRAMILVGDAPYYARAGFVPLAEGSVKFPGPVDDARILGLALVPGALDTLKGEVRRARIDEPVCADGAPLAGFELAKRHSTGQQAVE